MANEFRILFLKECLQPAIDCEDYEHAARIRDAIQFYEAVGEIKIPGVTIKVID